MRSKVFKFIRDEKKRQKRNIELIASENFTSKNVMRAVGSCLTNKYAEGYPAERPTGNTGRYYGGCENVDRLEQYCCEKWQEVFKTDYHVNVQPHSGTQANMAAFAAVLKPGDIILSMSLDAGGHLSHGSPVNFSGKIYNIVNYDLNKYGIINMQDVREKAERYKPKLILAGASAYPRIIDFEAFYEIAKNCGAYFMVDMAHIAGLVATGEHPSPFGLADIITTTTHKTLRGTRGGLIFCKPELAKKVDSAVFPCTQGGGLMHVIAGKAVTAEEACTRGFRKYIHQVVKNTRAMCAEFKKMGYEIVTNGTDNHLFLIDFSHTHPNLTGKQVQEELDLYGITVNKNCVPGEKRNPKDASGIRIGLAAMTTKGWKEYECVECAYLIDEIIKAMSGGENETTCQY